MSSSPPQSSPGTSASTPYSGLQWWHWLLFLLPTAVTVITTKVLLAAYQSQEQVPGSVLFSAVAALIYGFSAGALGSVLCGIVFGMTMPVRNRTLACIGWSML